MAKQLRTRLRQTPLTPELQSLSEETIITQEKAQAKPVERVKLRTNNAAYDAEPVVKRTRRRKATVDEDMFYVPLDQIPEGLVYEWKRWTNVGQEDPYYIAKQREQGWEPVPPTRHPTWVPPGYKEAFIIKGGQILMDRPKELHDDAQRELRQLSKRMVIEAEQRLGRAGAGEAERVANLKKEYMRPIPMTAED